MSFDADELERLKVENAELRARVWVLEQDVASLGPENVRLSNAYAAARAEIARLNQPNHASRLKKDGTPRKGNKGRNPKNYAGSYEEYLYRETMQIVTQSMWDGGKRLSEEKACVIADERIRRTAEALQKADMPGAFSGIRPIRYVQRDHATIYAAFRRAKRAWGFCGHRSAKK